MAFLRRKQEKPEGAPPARPEPQHAPTLFRSLIKDHWAPALRAAGLRGSGRTFLLPDSRDWAMLGFQSSTASNAQWVKFTVNLLVVNKEAWKEARKVSPHLSVEPSPNTLGPHRYSQRLGFLTHGRDHWWKLDASQDPEALTSEILSALVDLAVPALRREIADQSPGPRGTFGDGGE